MTRQKHLIVIGGATASGKTTFAIRLAQHFQTSVLSADSRQFYRELSIGTAKPTPTELKMAPHYFINTQTVTDRYSVGAYEQDALQLLHHLFEKQDKIILVGGSGLYVRAVCHGLDEFPEVDPQVRLKIERLYAQKGLPALQQALKEQDPAYFKEVDLQNPHRLIRALSVIETTQLPFSSFRQDQATDRPFTCSFIQVHQDRETLYDRINRRVDAMVDTGLEEEAKKVYPYRKMTALQTVGYQEWFDYFDGKTTREEAIQLIKQNSRRYAKRQLSWHRRDGFWKHFRPEEVVQSLDYLDFLWEKNGKLEVAKHPESSQKELRLTTSIHRSVSALVLSIQKFTFYFWANMQPPEATPEYYLWHEVLLRAEETNGILILPVSTEPFAKEVGCIPVAQADHYRRIMTSTKQNWLGSSYRLWWPPSQKITQI